MRLGIGMIWVRTHICNTWSKVEVFYRTSIGSQGAIYWVLKILSLGKNGHKVRGVSF